MRLPKTNAVFSHKKRQGTGKKADVTKEQGLVGMLQDQGTTSDGKQLFKILFNVDDVVFEVDNTSTFSDGTNDYKVMWFSKKTYHYEIKAIKV